MAQYLSGAWIEELNQAGATVGGPGPETARPTLLLQQVVTGGPHGEVAYAVQLGDRLKVVAGRIPAPDVTITEDLDTAVAVGRGDLSPQDALLAGRVRVSGNVGALLEAQEALSQLAAIFDAVRSRTTF